MTDARPEQVAPLPTTRQVRPHGPRRTDASAPSLRSRSRPSRTSARRRSNRGTATEYRRRTWAHGGRPPVARAIQSRAPPTSRRPTTPSTNYPRHVRRPPGRKQPHHHTATNHPNNLRGRRHTGAPVVDEARVLAGTRRPPWAHRDAARSTITSPRRSSSSAACSSSLSPTGRWMSGVPRVRMDGFRPSPDW